MSKYIRQLGAPLALTFALALSACDGDDDELDTLAVDTALASDLALAGGDTAIPQLEDEPAGGEVRQPAAARPAPRRTAPRATTPTRTPSGNEVSRGTAGAERNVATVPAGTQLTLAANEQVCSHTDKAGETFTANTTAPVTVNGVTIPAGARAVIRIANVRRSENATEPVVMTFAIQSISWGGRTYQVAAEVTSAQVDRVRTATKESDVKKVVGGAVAGAIIGQVLGKDTKSTVIGAATGAAAGTAVAMATGDVDGCIPSGGRIVIRLTEPMQVQV